MYIIFAKENNLVFIIPTYVSRISYATIDTAKIKDVKSHYSWHVHLQTKQTHHTHHQLVN